MAPKNSHYRNLLDVAKLLHTKKISPVELTMQMLRRINVKDRILRSYATVTPELAIKQAKKAEQEIAKGRIRGPLHGIPIAVKDLCFTRGIPTAAGMSINKNFKPKFDSTVVRRLANAGSVLLGKLQMTEGAFAEHHPEISPPINPWNKDYWPGASSSGSGVATAAGLCFASLGSDTGGSIRFPSAANGLSGLKPTWGRVSRYGVFDLAPTLDHVGPMCRSVADAAAVLGAIAGVDSKDPTAVTVPVPNYLATLERGIKGIRFGIDRRYNRRGVDQVTAAKVGAAFDVLKKIGADIREVSFPNSDEVVEEWLAHCSIETAYAHRDTYPKRKDEYGPSLATLIELGSTFSATDYQKILLHRHEFCGRVRSMFEDIDILIIPAQPNAAPTLAEMAALGDQDPGTLNALLQFTAPSDVTGSPALTLPAGYTKAGMPIAFQFIGRHFEEDILFRAGHKFQLETDWHLAHPTI